MKLAKASRYLEAADICTDALDVITSDEEYVVLKYSQARLLLYTKSLPNLEKGYVTLKQLHNLERVDRSGQFTGYFVLDWKSKFPAIYYGLGEWITKKYNICGMLFSWNYLHF